MRFYTICIFTLCFINTFAEENINENICKDSVKIKIYNKEKQEFLSNYKVVPLCTRDYPYYMFDKFKVNFLCKGDSVILSKKELFPDSKSCNPFNPLILIMKEKEKLYLFFEINESVQDTTYFGEW